MQLHQWIKGLFALLGAVTLLVSGCGHAEDKAAKGKDASKGTQVAEKKGHDHGDWWCAEHGIPEEECSLCSAKVAKACKDKGDWCKEHERAKSQCFICDPKLKETFAAKYRAKYGKEPPPLEDDKSKKDETKKDEKK